MFLCGVAIISDIIYFIYNLYQCCVYKYKFGSCPILYSCVYYLHFM